MQRETFVVGNSLACNVQAHDLGSVSPHLRVASNVLVIHTFSRWKQGTEQEKYRPRVVVCLQRLIMMMHLETS
jgi:hypothetical protein